MIERATRRRKLVSAAALMLLAGCSVVPKGPGQRPAPPPGPSPDALPTDTQRHRIALLVPLTGSNAVIGQSIANAATMAVLDTNANNLRLTSYDTGTDAGAAAARAIADGNQLVLGPVLTEEVEQVARKTRPARLPIISFANDEGVARSDVFVMGSLPGQSVRRTVTYARSLGIRSFGALVPRGDYGQRASSALMAAAREGGGSVVAMEPYDRSNTSVISAARRLREKADMGAILIADSARIAMLAAPELKAQGNAKTRLLGTELWAGESALMKAPALKGALFASVPDGRFRQFSASYKARFGAPPHRVATLGYDAVLLTLRVAREWPVGRPFPVTRLLDHNGFLGLDGPFRFGANGIVERALEVREIRGGTVTIASPAPDRFAD